MKSVVCPADDEKEKRRKKDNHDDEGSLAALSLSFSSAVSRHFGAGVLLPRQAYREKKSFSSGCLHWDYSQVVVVVVVVFLILDDHHYEHEQHSVGAEEKE